MILAFDTYYFEDKAKTVCISFNNWDDNTILETFEEIKEEIEEYKSGEFYKRELPCILSLYSKINFSNLEAIIIDGYIYLDDDKKPGLGAHLHEKLNCKIPIIGVAKTNFYTLTKNKIELFRGMSKNPLYITSIGMDINDAFENIKKMDGEFRIPKLLKELDRQTKLIE